MKWSYLALLALSYLFQEKQDLNTQHKYAIKMTAVQTYRSDCLPISLPSSQDASFAPNASYLSLQCFVQRANFLQDMVVSGDQRKFFPNLISHTSRYPEFTC